LSTRPRRSEYAKYWGLDPNITFLNHGSFGACPTEVLEYQSKLRLQIEKDPVRFFEYECLPLWHDAIESLSGFINANPEGMTFQNNATAGVNSVLRSLKFERGDEIIVPNHAYQACWNAIEFIAKRWGAKVIVVDIPFIVEEDDQIIELILTAITERTKLALIDTVTSPTGMRMPFERLVTEIQGRGVDVLLDAAHGPGIVPLNLEKLDVAYMTGNCHKWLCTPKGSAFLHIREDRKSLIKPLNISHGYSADLNAQEKFRFEFDWTGTQDPTPWLCIPKAIESLGSKVAGGWPEILERNRKLAIYGRKLMCEALGSEPSIPESMVTSLAAAEISSKIKTKDENLQFDPLHTSLFEDYGIQIPVWHWPHHNTRYIRLSAALYNGEEEYQYLAKALKESL
jgi:isopenicillin-N epimerase